MRAQHEKPKRRGGAERRGSRDGAVRRSRRASADSVSARRTRPGQTSAPTGESRAPKAGPQTSPITRPVERTGRPKTASQAKARAKARKAKAPKVVRPRLTDRLAVRLASIDLRPRTLANKVPFVVLVIGALGVGLGLTLWLSTDSAERSYQLSHAREKNRLLQQQKEALERDVHEAESAPALAEAARKQGMIPTRDTAHLVQDPSGNWVVVGSPKPADGVPPPPLNSKLPDEGALPLAQPGSVPPEVPVRLEPAPGAPVPARPGPELLLRAPDGSTTIGGQHLPAQPVAPLPGMPGMPSGPGSGQLPGAIPSPGLPAPAAPALAPVPAEVPIPLGGLPIPAPAPMPAPLPAEVPVPVQPAMVPAGPQVLIPAPPAAAPQPAVPLQPGPADGAQVGPPAVAAPGAAR